MITLRNLFITAVAQLATCTLQAGTPAQSHLFNKTMITAVPAAGIANNTDDINYCPQDTVAYYYWSDSGTWQPVRRNIITRRSSTEWSEFISQVWRNGAWQNTAQFTVTYNNNNQVESELRHEWNNGALTTTRYNYSYDAAHNNTAFLAERLNSGIWTPLGMDTFTYDNNNNNISALSKQWVNGAWVNRYLNTSTYDNNNLRLTYLVQQWNGNNWLNEYRNTYTYNAAGNMLQDTYQEWLNGAWINGGRYTYSYDANNNPATYLTEDWNNSTWQSKWQYTYNYDAANNKISELSQEWSNGNWQNVYRDTLTYNTANQLTWYLNQQWTGGTWQNAQEKENTYDASGNRTYSTRATWTNGVLAKTRTSLTYNANGRFTHSVVEALHNGNWINAERVEAGCNQVTGVNEPEATVTTSIFPNPSNGIITLAIAGTSAVCRIDAFDALGALVYSNNLGPVYNNSNFALNMQNLAAGVYTLQVSTENKSAKIKCVLSK